MFDEVDSGVGGTVADTVGRLMQQLGRSSQVLAVTHLPQVAACADRHLRVAKQVHEGRTSSQITPVDGEARVAELARMLGGETAGGTSMAHARELLAQASQMAAAEAVGVVHTPADAPPCPPGTASGSGSGPAATKPALPAARVGRKAAA
jgi:DNA repair protein RecN (Recombination protein N)